MLLARRNRLNVGICRSTSSATAAGERFVALGEALEAHSADEAAAHYLEAGAWQERAGNKEEAAALAAGLTSNA